MTDVATLKTRLLEAELALHKLSIGSLRETIMQTAANTSSQVTYTRASVADLELYIARLKSDLGIADGSFRGVRRPIHFT